MSVALFVDPVSDEYAAALELATFAAEAAIDSGEQLILSCSASAALEIGLSTLGQSSARMVEGGERRPSPIVLLPLIRDPNDPTEGHLRPDREHDSPGTLSDLIDLGIIAGPEEREFDPFDDRNPIEAFVYVMGRREVPSVVGLGRQPRFWMPALNEVRRVSQRRLIVVPEHFPPNLATEDPSIVRVHPAEIPPRAARREDDRRLGADEFEPFIEAARRQAALTAALIDRLSTL